MTFPQDYARSTVAVPVRPVIYAHRGSSLLRPENTAIAFDWALAVGADVLETDVRLSRDDRVMVVHDERLERTTDGRGAVRGHTARALGRLDAGYRFEAPDGRRWCGAGARLMPLEALFERYPAVRINIDIKDRDPQAAERVAATIARAGREEVVTVGSFHAGVLARFRQVAPGVATAASRGEVVALYFGRGRATTGRPYRFLQIPVRYAGLPLATPAFIRCAHARDVQCVYWTVNDEPTMRTLVGRGVAGIVTDRPDRLAGLLSVTPDPADPRGAGP